MMAFYPSFILGQVFYILDWYDIFDLLDLLIYIEFSACPDGKTYFFGAILFSDSPPFKLLRISKFPIIDKKFVVDDDAIPSTFPMNFFFLDHHGEHLSFYTQISLKICFSTILVGKPSSDEDALYISLSAGMHDKEGITVKLSLGELMNSLTVVNC